MPSFLVELIRFISSVTFLTLIIVTIPIAFDVGGRDCGLSFSLALAVYYTSLSILRLTIRRRSRARWLVSIAGVLQYVVVPALLIFCLDRCGDDETNGQTGMGTFKENATERFKRAIGQRADTVEEVGGANPVLFDRLTIIPWYSFLTIFSPIFQLVEGFCTLLVIQAVGQISKFLVNTKESDSWMIALLVSSGTIISWAVYFLWRIYSFPEIGNVDATLIGVTLTTAVFLCAYGIGSGRGNAIESSLLFSYVVLCMYQIFTDYKPNHPPTSPPDKPDFPPLPPMIMSSLSSIATTITTTLPFAMTSSFKFLRSVISTVTPSVLIALGYRLFVLSASTKIIPAIREGRGLEMTDEPGSGRSRGYTSWLMRVLRGFSPVAIVAVYTNLLMMHFATMRGGEADGSWGGIWGGAVEEGVRGWINLLVWTPVGAQVWRWVNVLATMALYAFELLWGQEMGDNGASLTSHWTTD